MLNEMLAFVTIIVMYFISFPIGYALLGKDELLRSIPFFVAVPIYASVGLTATALLIYAISFLLIQPAVMMIASIMAIIIILRGIRNRPISTISVRKNLHMNAVAIVLIVASLVYVATAVGMLRWPPPGDLVAHGLLVSLFRYNGYQSFTLEPFEPISLFYPTGLHVLAATIGDLAGLFSGEALLVTGALTLSLIPLLLFSLTYLITRSQIISIIPFLASFYLRSQGTEGMYLTGYFYGGPYANIFGFFLSTLAICLVLIARGGSVRAFYCLALTTAQLLVTYPSLVLTIGIISFFLVRNQLIGFVKKSGKILLPLILVIALISTLGILKLLPVISRVFEGMTAAGFGIILGFFYDWTTVVLIIATVASCISIVERNRSREVSVFFLITLALVVLSINDTIFEFIGWILPSRLVIISWLLSWVILASFVSDFATKKIRVKNQHIVPVACLAIIVILFQPSLTNQFITFKPAYDAAYYTHSREFPFDQNASIWISQNVPPTDIVLNDLSWSGFFLPSYSYKTVIFSYFPYYPEFQQGKQIWLHPDNETLVKSILSSLDIRWIFSASEMAYFDTWLYGGNQTYNMKPFGPGEYIVIFDNYTFLEKVYQCGNSTVYKVDI